MTTDTRTTLSEEDIERVADAAAEIGYEGTDATPLIALGEYGFMARKGTPFVEDSARESWDVLVHVPNDGYPGGPGFKFGSFDPVYISEWEEEDAPLFVFGYDDVDTYVSETPNIHRLANYIDHHNVRYPRSYVDEPHGPDATIELLRCYHDPDAEPTPGEARRILKDKAEQLASREPVPPHMTDQHYLAEFTSLHEDPLSVLRAATESNSDRRTRGGERLLDDVMSNWQSVPMSKFRDTETKHPVAEFVYTEDNTSNHH